MPKSIKRKHSAKKAVKPAAPAFARTAFSKPASPKKSNGFFSAYARTWTGYFDFKTRATRMEYWSFYLISAIVAFIPIAVVNGIYTLAVLIPSVSVSVRRLHDIGKSGWNYLILFALIFGAYSLAVQSEMTGSRALGIAAGVLLVVYIVLLLIWFARKGDRGSNKYGASLI